MREMSSRQDSKPYPTNGRSVNLSQAIFQRTERPSVSDMISLVGADVTEAATKRARLTAVDHPTTLRSRERDRTRCRINSTIALTATIRPGAREPLRNAAMAKINPPSHQIHWTGRTRQTPMTYMKIAEKPMEFRERSSFV